MPESDVPARGDVEACAALGDDLGWALGVLARSYRDGGQGGVRGAAGRCRAATRCCGSRPARRRPRQLALAQQLGIDRTVMTYLLDDLERAGLVERRPGPGGPPCPPRGRGDRRRPRPPGAARRAPAARRRATSSQPLSGGGGRRSSAACCSGSRPRSTTARPPRPATRRAADLDAESRRGAVRTAPVARAETSSSPPRSGPAGADSHGTPWISAGAPESIEHVP